MERDSFVFYRSFYEAIKDLDADSFKRIMAGICEYGLNSTLPGGLFGVENTIFTLIRPQLDANNKRYNNGKKGGQYGHLGGAPKGNSNAVKNWENIGKQPQWGGLNNPKTTPNDNVNDNVNVNVNENVNDINTLTADAVRGDIEKKVAVAKKNECDVDGKVLSKQDAINRLRQRMVDEGYSDTVVNLIMDFDEVKKGVKLHKQKDKGIKAFITTLNTRDTEQGKINVLNSAIAGPYQGIRPNRYSKPTNTKPVVSGNMFH